MASLPKRHLYRNDYVQTVALNLIRQLLFTLRFAKIRISAVREFISCCTCGIIFLSIAYVYFLIHKILKYKAPRFKSQTIQISCYIFCATQNLCFKLGTHKSQKSVYRLEIKGAKRVT